MKEIEGGGIGEGDSESGGLEKRRKSKQ